MKYFLLIIAALLVNPTAQAKPLKNDMHTCNKIEPALQAYIEQGVFQGSLLLAKDGQVLCQRNVGFTDQNKRKPISNTTRFPIASLSKPIVATLILKLQEDGTIDLQKTVGEYLPEFKAPWSNQVTLHHLLTNRSGLPSHFSLSDWGTGKYQKTLPMHDLLNDIAQMELAFQPGTQQLYSNLGWLLLGEVVQRTTNKGLEKNLQEHIFSPSSMKFTGLVYKTQTTLVTGLRWGKEGGWQPQKDLHMQVFNVGGGLYSTADDLLRYINALHQGNILGPKSQQLMFSLESPYGWRIETLSLANKTQKQVHTYAGQLQGHSSIMYHIPNDNLSLIILSNTGMGIMHKLFFANDILNAFYGALPDSNTKDLPSLILNRSLLDNQWGNTLKRLKSKPIENPNTKKLLTDLAQQLEWSGNQLKAIDLYAWLIASFPEAHELKIRFNRLCTQHRSYNPCLLIKT